MLQTRLFVSLTFGSHTNSFFRIRMKHAASPRLTKQALLWRTCLPVPDSLATHREAKFRTVQAGFAAGAIRHSLRAWL